MLTNTPCTVYNAYTQYGRTYYQRTVLDAVHWEDRRGAAYTERGVEGADSVEIMIPYAVKASQGRQYLPPKQWQALADKTAYWTLQEPGANTDKVVKGVVSLELAPGGENTKTLAGAYDHVASVRTVDTCDYGNLKHWAVVCK